VVTGAGEKAFSAGADIREFVAPLVPVQFASTAAAWTFARHGPLSQPILAAVNGFALGGGLDWRRVRHPRGGGPGDAASPRSTSHHSGRGGTQRLPRLVGRGKALEMILTGARIPADEALRIGLVERVVPAGEALKATLELARAMAAEAPVALRLRQGGGVKGLELPLADGLRLEGDLSTPAAHDRRSRGRRQGVPGKARARWTGK